MIARLFVSLIAIALFPNAIQAQDNPIPERRMIYESDVDYYGGDLRSIFDTTKNLCERTCLQEQSCQAFTFNTRAAACFLKTDIQRRDTYEGAMSARIAVSDPALVARAESRIGTLDFLREGQLNAASQQSLELARAFPDNGQTVEALLNNARSNSNRVTALFYAARAVVIGDSAAAWAELAGKSLALKDSKSREVGRARGYVVDAAINAYLRADQPAEQAQDLFLLAQGLEWNNQGRTSIDALRLAADLSPRQDIEEALDRAVRLFGFRVTGTNVDSNAQSPRICVTFNEKLIASGFEYAPYVNMEGANLAVEPSGNDLCIEGVEHGARVSFTLREGLPAASGETLYKSIEQNHYVRDREPQVRFAGRAYVLPKSPDAAIPVVTVNAEEVELSIHRITERNLVQAIFQDLIGSPLQTYQARQIDNNWGEAVWTGIGEVENTLNADVTTAMPIGDAVNAFEPGIYAMTATIEGVKQNGSPATQWFIVSDLGLSTMSGNDGLHVSVRGLSDALPRAGVTAQLVARNNDVLGDAVTDADGYAVFPAGLTRGVGGNSPGLITVRDGADDFAFIDLTEAGFDLSDRGVEGRSAPPPVDVFLSTERGAYRPGETVFATVLARNPQVVAIPTLPLTAVVMRPDGVEYSRTVLPDQGAGGRSHRVKLPDAAVRGTWRMRIYADTDAPALTETSFLVEDFVPERIDFTLEMPEGPVALNETHFLNVDARYLYGAPGADLSIEGELRLSPASSLAGFEGYNFGPHDASSRVYYGGLDGPDSTDETGNATLPLSFPDVEDVTRPLEMTAIVRLADASGRPVERSLTRPVAPTTTMIGIKPLFEGAAEEGAIARFNALAVGPTGAQVALGDVNWELARVHRTWQWYSLNGSWRYEPIVRRERVANGTLQLSADGVEVIEAPVEWGGYELTLSSTDGGYTLSSQMFYAGWYSASGGADTPDQLQVSLDKETYAVGDTARVLIEARDPGQVIVNVLSDGLITTRSQAIEAGATEIELPVTEDWRPGVYVMATHIQPLDTRAGRNPSRAIGLGWVAVDPGASKLDVAFTSPDTSTPRGPLVAELQVQGVQPGQEVYATIAAVDLGILNITAFQSPAPVEYYLGQRELGMDIRDVYGRLIDGMQGNRGKLRSGGDDTASGSKSPPPTQDLVAFFEGVVKADETGKVTASFDIPDFNGTVRLMAVVWSEQGVGEAQQDVIVRDPVVVNASLPRFLAPGDRSRLLLELANIDGGDGVFDLSVQGQGGLPVSSRQSITLSAGERTSVSVPLRGGVVSDDSAVTVNLTLPTGKILTKKLRLAIVANDPIISRQSRFELSAGGEIAFTDDIFAGLQQGSGDAVLSAGPLARFDAPGLLSALSIYAYGCTEQTTSKALALVYFNQVAAKLGGPQRANINTRIAQGIERVLGNQGRDGSFGLWSSSSDRDLWLDAYVTDFLSRARAEGHTVPDRAFEQALDNLQNSVNSAGDFEDGGEGIAYALYTLAREGRASMGDLRYYADARADNFATPLAKAQIGAALAAYGDPGRADSMLRQAVQQVRSRQAERNRWRADYGTYLRDDAAVLTLAIEAGSNAVDKADLADRLVRARSTRRYFSTQEQLWSLLAARALTSDTTVNDLTLNGQPVEGPLVETLTAAGLAGTPVTLGNFGQRDTDVVLSVFGVPETPEPAGGNGYSITRAYYDLEGNTVDPAQVTQNQRLLTVLTVIPERETEARLMVTDPLPAGFEIENPSLIRAGDISALSWLELEDYARYTEFATDRFSAAVDWSGSRRFQLAYLVRVISPGEFHHPAASVEDMYRPAYRARSETGHVTVLAAQ